MTHIDRRRLVVATIITLLALPVLAWLNARNNDPAATVDQPAPELTSTTAYRPEHPVFLDVDTRPDLKLTLPIDVGPPPSQGQMVTSAAYRQIASGRCITRLVPLGSTINVRNIDTGQTLRCVTTTGSMVAGVGIVINTGDFAKIADLADAPIHVRITRSP